jgi:hypothetical protein
MQNPYAISSFYCLDKKFSIHFFFSFLFFLVPLFHFSSTSVFWKKKSLAVQNLFVFVYLTPSIIAILFLQRVTPCQEMHITPERASHGTSRLFCCMMLCLHWKISTYVGTIGFLFGVLLFLCAFAWEAGTQNGFGKAMRGRVRRGMSGSAGMGMLADGRLLATKNDDER